MFCDIMIARDWYYVCKDFCVQNFITITLIEATMPLIEDQKNVQRAGRKVTFVSKFNRMR